MKRRADVELARRAAAGAARTHAIFLSRLNTHNHRRHCSRSIDSGALTPDDHSDDFVHFGIYTARNSMI